MHDLPTTLRKVRHIAGTFERIDGTLVIAFDVPEHLYSDGLIKAWQLGLQDRAALAYTSVYVTEYLNMYLKCKVNRLAIEGCKVIDAGINLEPVLSKPLYNIPMVKVAMGEQQEKRLIDFMPARVA